MMRNAITSIAFAILAALPAYAHASSFHHHTRHVDTSASYAPMLEKANAGDATAQYVIGMRFERGQDVKQNSVEATNWFRKAAEQGHSMAQLKLGDHFQYGKGVPVDLAQAAKWYQKAAEQDNFAAQHALGKLYLSGDGVKQDFVEAYFWLSIAADDRQYAVDREHAANLLKPDQLSAMTARVDKWHEDRKAAHAEMNKKEKKG
jgi:TPR repeat protein